MEDHPGGVTQTHSYDAGGRRSAATSTATDGTTTRVLARKYTDTGDNPTWTEELVKASGAQVTDRTTTTRYLGGLGGDLTATHTAVTEAGVATAGLAVMLANPHGDITATVDLPDTGAPAGISTWSTTDEYGNPTTAHTSGSTPAGGATPAAYGWLGAKERSADTPAGLTLMGARLYNPTTGLFTSLDPVYGGNENACNYPNDPINQHDLDGKARWWKSKKFWKRAAMVAGTRSEHASSRRRAFAWGRV